MSDNDYRSAEDERGDKKEMHSCYVLAAKKPDVMQKAGVEALTAMTAMKMMYNYVEKLLGDGKKSRLMGTSRIDKQRDVRLRIVL